MVFRRQNIRIKKQFPTSRAAILLFLYQRSNSSSQQPDAADTMQPQSQTGWLANRNGRAARRSHFPDGQVFSLLPAFSRLTPPAGSDSRVGKISARDFADSPGENETGSRAGQSHSRRSRPRSRALARFARATAKLAFPGQDVKLHQEFQTGKHQSFDLASVQTTENLPVFKTKGWMDAETTPSPRRVRPSGRPSCFGNNPSAARKMRPS